MKKLLIALCFCGFASAAQAEMFMFVYDLDCAQASAGAGTCAAGGSGTGTGTATLDTDTNMFSWNVTFSGLSAAVAAAHFHGPATRSENAGVVVPIGTSSPDSGSAVITEEQASDLIAGHWYLNIHSANFPGGEIRGQVEIFSIPACDIQFNQRTYTDGDTIVADVFRLANPGATPVAIEVKSWLTVPGLAPISLLNAGADGRLVFPPNTVIDVGPVTFLTVDPGLPRGTWESSCRMLDPVTGALLMEDLNFFEVE